MAKSAQAGYANRNKAYEVEGPKVRVAVLATKVVGRAFAHLGGFFKYDPNATLGLAVARGTMSHHSGFAFPADGRMHEYTFPQEFAERLVKQAAELPDAFEVHLLAADTAALPAAVQFVGGHKEAALTEPVHEDEDAGEDLDEDEAAADREDDED